MTKPPPKITALVASLLAWFARDARDLPWRRTRDPYAIWVSEIMLQQTQVKTVIPYWERWMQALPTIAAAAAAPADQIHKLWEGLGYYTRVRNLQTAAQAIVSRHGGKFPAEFDAVLALPGIGRYTAGAICSIAFNQPVPILDGNVIRVLTRLFAIAENPRDKATNTRLWLLATQLVQAASATPPSASRPAPRASFLNQSLMELGALLCTPRQPQCLLCPVQACCDAFRQQRTEEFPNLGKRVASTARAFLAFVVESRGHVLVRQRPAGVVNAHLWEFPNIETTGPAPDLVPLDWLAPSTDLDSPLSALCNGGAGWGVEGHLNQPSGKQPKPLPATPETIFQSLFHKKPLALRPLSVVKHTITRYRITLTAYTASLPRPPAKLPGQWVKLNQLNGLAFTAAHKKLAQAALNLASGTLPPAPSSPH